MSSNSTNLSEASLDRDKEIQAALIHVLDVVEMNQERNYISNSLLFDELLGAYASKLTTNLLVPISCSKDYTGVHLGQLYEDADLRLMLKMFKHNGVLDAFYALRILTDAEKQLEKLSNISRVDATQQACIIVGDLHGNFHDLYHLINKYDLPGKQYQFVFNGDLVDRGSKQIEVLLTILYAFLLRPDKVFINRGNHEDLAMNTSGHFNPNFMSDCRRKYGKYATTIFNKATSLFSSLSLATIVQTNHSRAFVVHGGISDKTDLEYISQLDRKSYKRILTASILNESEPDYELSAQQLVDILWSDPIYANEKGKIVPSRVKKLTGCYFNQTRNLGSLFGVDISDKFCKKHGFNYIIRSHECREKGFSQDHPKCYTVFSASYYLNSNNMGAVILMTPTDKKFQVYAYSNIGGDLSNSLVLKNHSLLGQFKHLIQLNHFNLLPQFKKYDVSKSGVIQMNDWANVLSQEFEISNEHLLLVKDYLCECDSNYVYYQSMFKKTIFNDEESNLNAVDSQNYLMLVKSLFEIIDKNHDNHISLDEAREALRLISKSNSKYYTSEEECLRFIKQFDVNCDNLIDLNEFYKAFFYDEFAYTLNKRSSSVSSTSSLSKLDGAHSLASSSDSSICSRSASQSNISNGDNDDQDGDEPQDEEKDNNEIRAKTQTNREPREIQVVRI